jgi:hypothetical protein
MSTVDQKKKIRYPGSLLWPVVLIVIGVVFLMNNLGMLSQSAWDTILLCWPLLLIVIGLDNLLRRDGAAVPTFFIGLGVIFMLSNFGQLAWSVWAVLWGIWPVFLVAIGLDIMFGRRSIWAGLLAGVLVIAILGGILWFFGSDLAGEKLAVDTIGQSFEGAKQAEISIKPLVGSLSLAALSDSNSLIEGKIKRLKGENIQQDYRVQNGVGYYDLASLGGTIIFPTSPGPEASWDLGLTMEIPLDLNVNMIIGKSTVEAQNLNLSSLSTSMVIGETIIYLPERGDLDVKIDGVIGSIVIYVPDSMEIRINSEVGLLNVQVPDDYLTREDTYYSPGFSSAENRVEVDVSQVIGQVQVLKK